MPEQTAEVGAAIIDSSCLIHLWKLQLVKELVVAFSRIYIPLHVQEEVRRKGRSKRKLRELIRDLNPFLQICNVGNSYDAQLLYDRQLNPHARIGRGESEVIIQARERQISQVLIDDKKGKQIAVQHTLIVADLLDILGILKKNNIIDEVKPLLNKLGKNYIPKATRLKIFLKDLEEI